MGSGEDDRGVAIGGGVTGCVRWVTAVVGAHSVTFQHHYSTWKQRVTRLTGNLYLHDRGIDPQTSSFRAFREVKELTTLEGFKGNRGELRDTSISRRIEINEHFPGTVEFRTPQDRRRRNFGHYLENS